MAELKEKAGGRQVRRVDDAVASYDPAREALRLDGARSEAMRQPEGPKRAKKLERAERRAVGALTMAVNGAQKHGAALPNVSLMFKSSWRVQQVDTPEGSNAKPAYVVVLDGNSILSRLARAPKAGVKPALEPQHLRAAERVASLYFASMKSAKLAASYQGMHVQDTGEDRPHMIDVACEAWGELRYAMNELLPVEQTVVMEVAIYETPIEALTKRPGVTHYGQPGMASAAVVTMLRTGLDRLVSHWRLDGHHHENA